MSEPNINKWLEIQNKETSPSILNESEFIKILGSTYKITPLFEVIHSEEGKPMGIPAFWIKRIFRKDKITSMPFNFYPPMLGEKNSEDAFLHLINIAKEINKNCYVEFKTYEKMSLEEYSGRKIYSISTSIVSTLKIKNTYEEQVKKYQKRLYSALKTNTKRAKEFGFKFYKISSHKELKSFYKVLVRLYRDKHQMITQPYNLFKELFSFFRVKDMLDVYVASLDGKIEAGIFVLKSKYNWDYCWGASSEEYYKLSLNSILIDMMIQEAIEQKVESVSMGSSAPSDKDLIFFKERWGCESRPVYYYYWNHKPEKIDLNKSYKFIRKIYSKMPLFLLEKIPNYVVPYLV